MNVDTRASEAAAEIRRAVLVDTDAGRLKIRAPNTVRARFGEKGLVELIAIMSAYLMNATILRAMEHKASMAGVETPSACRPV